MTATRGGSPLAIAPVQGPHGNAELLTAGASLATARSAVVLCHGRGAVAHDMLTLHELFRAPDTTFVAPQASGGTWYPYTFMAPLSRNEPHLSSALALLGAVVDGLARAGIPPSHQLIAGFSQGGCLALEFVGRNAQRLGGLAGLSAGLPGPPGRQWDFAGSLEGTPVLLGCSDRDSHIPRERVEESATEFARIGGTVDLQIYPGLGHTINNDEIRRMQSMLDALDAL